MRIAKYSTHGQTKCTMPKFYFYIIILLSLITLTTSLFCKEGYVKAKNRNQCIEKRCNCKNGKPARGAKCKVHRSRQCVKCKNGFHLEYNQCLINKCTCKNGIGIIGGMVLFGKSCHNHGDVVCVSCESGYHLRHHSCHENICKCENGQSYIGRGCKVDGNEICRPDGCNKGYLYNQDTKTCDNYCLCPSGTAHIGQECSKHLMNSCLECDAGYKLRVGAELSENDNKRSTATSLSPMKNIESSRDASLPGLVPIKEIFCEPICDYRTSYYSYYSDNCEKKECLCPNGVGKKGENCSLHMKHECESCDYGFKMEESDCIFDESLF